MIARILRHRFVRGVMTVAGGAVAAQVLGVLAYPLLTRLYTPDDFGVLTVFNALLNVFVTVCTLRYHMAIPLADGEQAAADLVAVSLLFTAITCVLCWLWIGGLGDRIAELANVPALAGYLWLLPLIVFIAGTYQTFTFYATRHRWFGAVARTRISQSLGSIAAQIIGGLVLKGTPTGLFWGQAVGQFVGTPNLALQAWRSQGGAFRGIRWEGMRSVMGRFRRFPLYATWGALLYTLSTILPSVLLAAFYGPTVAGLYAVGARVVRTPLEMLATAVAQVFYADGARLFREDPAAFARMYWRVSATMLAVAAVPALVLGLFGPWLFALLLGDEWGTAGEYMRLLSLMYLAQFVMNPVSQTLNILERQGVQTLINGLRLLLMALTITVPALLGLPAETAILIYSAGISLVYLGAWFVVTAILRRTLRTRLPATTPPSV